MYIKHLIFFYLSLACGRFLRMLHNNISVCVYHAITESDGEIKLYVYDLLLESLQSHPSVQLKQFKISITEISCNRNPPPFK